jgi:vancomycin resistance protein YoaR
MARHPIIVNIIKSFKQVLKSKLFIPFVVLSSVIILVTGFLAYYFFAFTNKVYPNVILAGTDIGRLSLADAQLKISKNILSPEVLTLSNKDQDFLINPEDVDFSYNLGTSLQNAYKFTRTGNIIGDFKTRIDLLFHQKYIVLTYDYDAEKLTNVLTAISDKISVKSTEPSVKLIKGEIIINKGAPGNEVDLESLKQLIILAYAQNNFEKIEIPIGVVDKTLNQNQIDSLRLRAEKFIGKDLQLKFEFNSFNLSDSDLISLMDPISGYLKDKISDKVQEIANDTNRAPQNPKFVFENGRVSEFQPALDGVSVDIEKLTNLLNSSFDTLADSTEKNLSLDIPVVKTPPEITTGSVNNLGIKELIGRGTSTFYHSIPGRIHNVVLAASRINGTLVPPGQTFSFNQTLGDVSQFTGYQQAYIISDGKTILGDGGGVCQVSTTLFRSLLNAGLPITERQAHAYRVGYYEQDSPPGLDATVYSPSPDLKFINDTPAHILIQATANPKNYSLVFELYGTSDGRVATISKPIVTNVSAPPADLYQDDPTLPIGTIRQIDFKAWGAKVTFNYSVKRGGEEIYKKTFISNYRPWQAIYLKGTKP